MSHPPVLKVILVDQLLLKRFSSVLHFLHLESLEIARQKKYLKNHRTGQGQINSLLWTQWSSVDLDRAVFPNEQAVIWISIWEIPFYYLKTIMLWSWLHSSSTQYHCSLSQQSIGALLKIQNTRTYPAQTSQWCSCLEKTNVLVCSAAQQPLWGCQSVPQHGPLPWGLLLSNKFTQMKLGAHSKGHHTNVHHTNHFASGCNFIRTMRRGCCEDAAEPWPLRHAGRSR